MKKLILIVISAASISAYGLPTYEPFTEYASQIASSPINLVVTYANGTPVGTNANAGITNCLDLATGGYTAPGGEQWGILNFSGTGSGNPPYANCHGLDIAVVTNGNIFTPANLASLLPSTFPGFPASAGIAPIVENPAQPLLWFTNAAKFTATNIVGNSAVLKFAQPVARPTSGTKTVYVSYLFDVAQLGQLGTGNNGRYLAFLASTNLVEGTNTPGGVAYTNWGALFNTFNGSTATGVHYPSHGLIEKSASVYYIGACDSTKGSNWSTTALSGTFGAPVFVVGAYVLNSGAVSGTSMDTNIVWVNPPTNAFGGAPPPLASGSVSNHLWTMGFNMSDLGGLVFIDRPGNGASGGVGTNYIANLLIGSTWSYVTGGPEFTNQPPAITSVNLGGTGSLSGAATAANQSVSYYWQKYVGGTWQTLTDGTGIAGGAATVSGSGTSTLNLTDVSAGDTGDYQLVATASGTTFILASATANLRLSDPRITANPANTTANYGGSASFTATVTTASAPLTYQWYDGANALLNGTQPDGSFATGATGTTGAGTSFTLTLTLSGVSYQDIGSYSLNVINSSSFNNSSAPAMLTVNDPIITAQPANPAVVAGGNATFTVAAAGSPTVNYQWYEGATALTDNGTTIGGSAVTTGTQTPTLILTHVEDADNGSYHCTVTGSASLQTTNSAAATLTVQDALTIVTPPVSLAERVGDHLAFTVVMTGGGPQFQWKYNGNPISGATTSALVLTNIQTGSNGTYSVTVQNLATTAQTFSAILTVINSAILPLSSTNLVVARVGDGAQPLSGATGNTVYLDQYTPAGSYVNTLQVPDEGTGQAYGTGSSFSDSMPFGSPALLVQGAGSDAAYEAMLTLSGVNQQYLCFAGYCLAYPYSGSDMTVAGAAPNANWRGLATIDADGIYSLAYTNLGFYTGNGHTIRSMVTLDGTNFWTTGQAGAGTVKFVNSTVTNYANGVGLPSSAGTGVSSGGGHVIQIVNGALTGFSSISNLVYSETGSTNNNGLYAASGTPEPGPVGNVTFTALLYTGSDSTTTNYAQPGDFAFSPDNQTVYVADARPFTSTSSSLSGGIQRWDANNLGGFSYSYTLAPLTEPTNGAVGLTVDFSAHATWGTGTNGAKLYATTYGATGNSLISIVDTGASSAPTVLATAGANKALRGVRFGPAVVLHTRPQFTSAIPGVGGGFQLSFTGPAGTGYSIWTTTSIALSPLESTWTKLTTGTFSGGTDTYTDPSGGTNPHQFYIISVP
jgi:hypothetical protein